MKQLLLLSVLSMLPMPLLAAMPNLTPRQIVYDILILVGLGLIFGLLVLLIRKAPGIPADVKQWIEYALYVLVVIAVIFVILSFIGQ